MANEAVPGIIVALGRLESIMISTAFFLDGIRSYCEFHTFRGTQGEN
ncbi:MAG: hypothetical protein ACYSP9_05700 [Planctomycetota bacterium]